MNLLNEVPDNCSVITPGFIAKWKETFDKVADYYLAEKSYNPVNVLTIARELGCIVRPIPEDRLDEKNGNGDKVIGFFSMHPLPIISLKASFDEDYDRRPDYRVDSKVREKIEATSEPGGKKLILSRKLDEGRANRFVMAYYSAVANILTRNPQLGDDTYHIMYDGYDNAELYLGGLPFYFAMRLLLNEKTLARCSSNVIGEIEHFMSVDAKLIRMNNKLENAESSVEQMDFLPDDFRGQSTKQNSTADVKQIGMSNRTKNEIFGVEQLTFISDDKGPVTK